MRRAIYEDDVIKLLDKGWKTGIYPVASNIHALPSAQPEILLCKDCYWWTRQEDSLQGRCDRYGMYPTGYWYCAAARERRGV